ncbi:helix-turn-helix domain-containing protein [Ulvibacter antarcticus]|uniref:AraC-like DNA-binding protein n=1 Tax=Ulvibacter antarcticus TaxID=442714 RepID=A0A3L9YXB3_9FLAO|nr:helix-turn-helix domain-containing protein [Ulvibacter antarcticus]RMA64467.1 AraC-like DNA-binding protein [Ulvibacter antarcticus]
MKFCLSVLCILVCQFINAQDLSPSHLKTLDDEELLTLFNEVVIDSLKAEVVARTYLNRARQKHDTIKMARGYDRLARIFHPEKNIQFADSIIELTKDLDNITYPGLGYILKSYEYQGLGKLIFATENAITAYDIAIERDNMSQQIYLLDLLIKHKAIWGNKLEALNLQRLRHKLMNDKEYLRDVKSSTREGAYGYLKEIHLENELSSILNFAFCYINLKKMDSAEFYINRGINTAESYVGYTNESDFYYYLFLELSIENDYNLKKYKKSIDEADELIKAQKGNISNQSYLNVYLFKGLSLLKLGKKVEGIENLNKADSIFDSMDKLLFLPNQRLLFESLVEFYDKIGHTEKQIHYRNKLLFVDSIFKKNYQFFEPDLIKKFETPNLIREKENLISELKLKNKKSKSKLWWVGSAVILFLIATGYYFNRQLVYKRKFERLIVTSKGEALKDEKRIVKTPEMSSEIFDSILSCLTDYEMKKGYLSQKTSLNSMATIFKTNSRYLSKVINMQKEKNFPQYINDLRVEYALQELTENPVFRKYSIKAIAADCGFKGAESFSKAFYKRHGIYPSYCIKKLSNRLKT